MAGAGVEFTYTDKDLQDLIKGAAGRINDMSPVMKSFAEYMVNRTDERFEKEQAPDGSPWAPLSDVTKARKAKLNKIDKILQQDGYLRLVHPDSDKKSASVYSDKEYAAIHNYGGKAGRNHSVTIQKREFLGFNDEDIQEFIETAKDFIILGMRGS